MKKSCRDEELREVFWMGIFTGAGITAIFVILNVLIWTAL